MTTKLNVNQIDVFPQTCGRFSNLGTSDPFPQCHLVPYNGNLIVINNRLEEIPYGLIASSGGVIATYSSCYLNGVAAQTLVADTFYYAYVFMNSGVMTLDFSETGPAWDTTNYTEVKSGDPTRALVGILYVQDVGGTLTTYGGARGQTVASLFNPFNWIIVTAISGPTTATTATKLPDVSTLPNGQPECNFIEWVQWYDKIGKVSFCANIGHSVDASLLVLGAGINSTSSIHAFQAKAKASGTANESNNLSGLTTATEGTGYIYAQAIGYSTTAGTSQFTGTLICEIQTP